MLAISSLREIVMTGFPRAPSPTVESLRNVLKNSDTNIKPLLLLILVKTLVALCKFYRL